MDKLAGPACPRLPVRVPASLYRTVHNSHREPVSVVVPVYQEDPVIFAHAIESWLANNVAEIILVIDASDRICQAVASHYPVTVVMTTTPDKRDALRVGWERARTPIVALVDSDTIWAEDVADRVCMPFADPRVGGVSTRQNVYNPKGFLQRVNDMYLDYRYFDENAAQTAAGRAISCISGRTAVYRRDLLLEVSASDLATAQARTPDGVATYSPGLVHFPGPVEDVLQAAAALGP